MFNGNTAEELGGAIYGAISEGREFGVNFLANQFRDNKANSDGGAVYIEDLDYDSKDVGGDIDTSITVNVSTGVFSGNQANSSGGALYISSRNIHKTLSMNVSESMFMYNVAKTGAATHLWRVTLLLRKSEFIKNRAKDGVLYCVGSSIHFLDSIKL